MPNILQFCATPRSGDRAHHHLIAHGILPLGDTYEMLRRVLDGGASSVGEQPILAFGLYGAALTRYYELFPANKIFAATQDELSYGPRTLGHYDYPPTRDALAAAALWLLL